MNTESDLHFHFEPERRDRRMTATLINEWIRRYRAHRIFKSYDAHEALPGSVNRYSWSALSMRAGGGLQLQIGTRSIGCSHFRKDGIGCVSCGLSSSTPGRIVSREETRQQVESALEDCQVATKNVNHISIQGDGSFLSPQEVPEEAVYDIAALLKRLPKLSTVSFETRLDLVTSNAAYISTVKRILSPTIRLEVALGLESSSEFVRNVIFRKGSGHTRLDDVFNFLVGDDIDVLLYVFFRPPIVTEQEGIFDSVRTIRYIHDVADRRNTVRWTAALQPSFVQPNTFLHWLYDNKCYSPPYLWSVAEIIRQTGGGPAVLHIGSPVDFPPPSVTAYNRTSRGDPCTCSEPVYKELLHFNLHQRVGTLMERLPHCPCYLSWKEDVEVSNLRCVLKDCNESVNKLTN